MKILQSKKIFFIAVGLVVGFLAYGGYRVWALNVLKNTFKEKAVQLERVLEIKEKKLVLIQQENLELNGVLTSERAKNQLFQNQIQNISGVVGGLSGTVGELKKLSETDKELLQKYSKTYFLNEHYVPSALSIISAEYIYDKNKPQQFHTNGLSFLERMFQAAAGENIILKIVSAYRSFNTQSSVKAGYKITYGSGANQFSADQGYSEHQLGTAVDFTSSVTSEVFSGFEKTNSYKWLGQNAYKFGFVLSYPSNNTYYQFESWHWRFVGVALATKLYNENKYFYELPQRDIDGYLVNIFD